MTNILSLAEKCDRCGGLFDLGFDLEVLEKSLSREEALEKVVCELKRQNGILCWDCRPI